MGILLKAKALVSQDRLGSNEASPPPSMKNLWKPELEECQYQNFRFDK